MQLDKAFPSALSTFRNIRAFFVKSAVKNFLLLITTAIDFSLCVIGEDG